MFIRFKTLNPPEPKKLKKKKKKETAIHTSLLCHMEVTHFKPEPQILSKINLKFHIIFQNC